MSRAAVELRGDPLAADETIARRIAELSAQVGPATARDVAGIVERRLAGRDGSTVPATAVARLVATHGLVSPAELALLALPVAAAMARPAISGYAVAAVGLERETGDLVLGANLEFPGSDLSTTVHAEGFVSLRARRRGATLATIALQRAQPCAHCRQTLAESSAADALTLIDPLGHVVRLGDLYPNAFRPTALGVDGDVPARASWPDLAFAGVPPPAGIGEDLLDAGRTAHAPYSGAPSAVVLEAADGTRVAAGCMESVAFNPTITAAQAALVELAAARIEPAQVVAAWLARTPGGSVDPEAGFRALLRAVAPGAEAHVAEWLPAGAATERAPELGAG